MACAQARTIRVRAAALPSESINHEAPPLQRLLLDSTSPLPYQQRSNAKWTKVVVKSRARNTVLEERYCSMAAEAR